MTQLQKTEVGGPSTFEEAVERLEEIVGEMEAGELPLEDVVSRVEEGMRLASFCDQKLKAAEERLTKLLPDAAGKPALTPLE